MLSVQHKLTLGLWHSELAVVCVCQVEQRCKQLISNVEQCSFLGNPHAGTILFQIGLSQVRCELVSRANPIVATYVN